MGENTADKRMNAKWKIETICSYRFSFFLFCCREHFEDAGAFEAYFLIFPGENNLFEPVNY